MVSHHRNQNHLYWVTMSFDLLGAKAGNDCIAVKYDRREYCLICVEMPVDRSPRPCRRALRHNQRTLAARINVPRHGLPLESHRKNALSLHDSLLSNPLAHPKNNRFWQGSWPF